MAGLTSRLQQAQLRRQGANAARAGNIAGLGSLLSGATQIGMATAVPGGGATEATGTYSSDWNYSGGIGGFK